MHVHTQKLNEDPAEHWKEAQADELKWWGSCSNTTWEEQKQAVYAKLMGIEMTWDEHGPYFIALGGKAVLDIGGGPVSMLLKAERGSMRTVVDPCDYPSWVAERYNSQGIEYLKLKGEQVDKLLSVNQPLYDEVWIYNVLQHTEDPAKIMANAKAALKPGGTLRVFEWINTEQNIAHPIVLSEELLTEWVGQIGQTIKLNETGCVGDAWYGAFRIGVAEK